MPAAGTNIDAGMGFVNNHKFGTCPLKLIPAFIRFYIIQAYDGEGINVKNGLPNGETTL